MKKTQGGLRPTPSTFTINKYILSLAAEGKIKVTKIVGKAKLYEAK